MPKRSLLALISSTFSALGATFIPAGGFMLLDWNPATVMMLYLVETLVSIQLTVARVRFLTGGRPILSGSDLLGKQNTIQGYLIVSLGMSLVCGVFMVMFLFVLPGASLDANAFRAGFQAILLLQIVGFGADLVWLRRQGPDQVDNTLTANLGRVALLYFAVFIGAFLAAVSIEWFLWPFVILKTMADLEQPWKLLRATR